MFTSVERKLFVFSFCLALLFAAFTGHLWEDYYITYRASKNLATGKGLVYTEGQRVHSFTSPLGVLLPAACSLATLNQSDDAAIWLFRLITSTFFGSTTILLYRIGKRTEWGKPACLLAVGLFVFDAKTVDYTINGMETSLLVFFLALTIYALEYSGEKRWQWLGGAWAGLMWTRPDGCIYIGALSVGCFFFGKRETWKQHLQRELPVLFKAALLTTVLYLPWFLWAWSYYGSPIPHTITAKGLGINSTEFVTSPRIFFRFARYIFSSHNTLTETFAPAYFNYGTWPMPILLLCRMLALLPMLCLITPGTSPTGRTCAFAFFSFHFYLTHVANYGFPWYFPGPALLAIISICDFLNRICVIGTEKLKNEHQNGQRVFRLCVLTVFWGLISLQLFMFGCVGLLMRTQQRVIEFGVRKPIGLWLKEHARSPRDTVFLEPLGYIGYFCQLKMLDWPGLSSPEVVAARRKTGFYDWVDLRLLPELRPDWLALRPEEYSEALQETNSYLSLHYRPVRSYDVSAEVEHYTWLPGCDYIANDKRFTIFKQIDASIPAPAAPK